MTTIAWDGKTLAADSLMIAGDSKLYTTQKAAIIDGCLCAGSGELASVLAMFDWIHNGEEKEKFPETQKGNDYAVIIKINTVGEIQRYEKTMHPIYIGCRKYAIGSGSHFALAAMECGKSAEEAVKIACKFDPYSGGEIKRLKLPTMKRLVNITKKKTEKDG